MTLDQLEVFAKVAKLKSFSLAGEKLRVRQPSSSIVIRALERELEAKLFERVGNKVHLTNAGEELLHEAEEILHKVERIKERMEELTGLKKGKLSVGGSSTAAASFLPVAIERFKKEHPGIQVILKIERSNSLEKKLIEGDLHLAVMGQAPCSPVLVGELYREEDIVVIAPYEHPLAKRRIVPLELIAKEPLITHERGTLIRDLVEKRFAEAGLPFMPQMELDPQIGARDAIRSAVAGGVGLGFLTKCHVEADVKGRRVKILRVPEMDLKRTIYIAVHKKLYSSPLVQAFIDFLRHHKS